MNNTATIISDLAEGWVNTDIRSIRADVRRLGSVEAAAEYSADMAIGQERWEPLATEEGREALVAAIRSIL